MTIVAPETEEAIRHTVACAFDANEPILVRGAGSKAAMLRPVQAARSVSTANLTGITLYSPNELVVAARAGTTMASLEATVAEAGQQLIAEPPDLSHLLGSTQAATIGGVVAANLSGPRRIAWGAMRDHVLGVRVVTGRGELLRGGGRVLKNVTGLDLCKLLSGSHGTLGVLTEITLKVLPAAETTGSVLLTGLTMAQGVQALSMALGSPFGVSGAAFLPAEAAARLPGLPSGSATLIRIEDFAASVAYRGEKLRALLAGLAQGALIEDHASRALWQAVRDAHPLPAEPGDAIWRLSLRPSRAPGVVAALEAACGARAMLDWGGGLVWLATPPTAAACAAISAQVTEAGGTWLLLRAPDALRTAIAVVPPEAPALARLTRRVKEALDPRLILNPGRIYAGL